MLAAYRDQVIHRRLHAASMGLLVVCVVATVLHYEGTYPGNPLTWAAWILSIGAYTLSFVRARPRQASWTWLRRPELLIALAVLAAYLITHLWNISSAPWNANGLFDDAAWDIYFARDHAFNGPYQAAFYDQVGLISRETVFHYYITSFFKLFGYNLVVFNASLHVLGFVTVLFTTLTVHRLFRNLAITVAAALVLDVLPLHYLHIFVGHRYAIAAPLMMISLYFLYSGFSARSLPRISLSALFVALCLGSAIMGKQVILALAAAAVILLIVDRRRASSSETRVAVLTWMVALAISAAPLVIYVAFNSTDYFRRESGLLVDFTSRYARQGYDGIKPFFDELGELFFAANTYRRMWLHEFPLVPPAYWLLLVPGLIVALARRRVEVVLLALIPVGSAFLAGAFDFRVLLAAPIWVIAMAYGLDWLRLGRRQAGGWHRLASVGAIMVLLTGLIPSTSYLWGVSRDSHAQYLLPHRDVAVARLIQDVVAGSPVPSSSMKLDEFNRPEATSDRPFDSLACAERAYAIAHLYLQAFDDRRILSLCDQANEALIGRDKLFATNAKAIAGYEARGKGLRLIWEESEIAQPALKQFRSLERYGTSQVISGNVDGEAFSIWVLTILPPDIRGFQGAVAAAAAAGP